ncbi:hypothetical protein ZWY2020_048111 [Hordeum vulgare]|nr:hypothetical protein ZWY2020_048111 [Hordeum vulgare]
MPLLPSPSVLLSFSNLFLAHSLPVLAGNAFDLRQSSAAAVGLTHTRKRFPSAASTWIPRSTADRYRSRSLATLSSPATLPWSCGSTRRARPPARC